MARPLFRFACTVASILLSSAASAFTTFPNATCPETLSIVRLKTVLNTVTSCAPQTGASGAIGDTVRGLGGIVIGFDTHSTGFDVFLQQSAGGQNSGIDVFTGGVNLQPGYGLALGDSLVVEFARVALFSGDTELESPNNSSSNPNIVLRRVSAGNAPPPSFTGNSTALRESPANTTFAPYVSALVTLSGPVRVARVGDTVLGAGGALLVSDSAPADSVFVDYNRLAGMNPPALGTSLASVTGIGNKNGRGFQVLPRSVADTPGAQPPSLLYAYAIADNQYRVVFDRTVTSVTATNPSNYSLESFDPVDGAVMDGSDAVILTVSGGPAPGSSQTVTASGIRASTGGDPMGPQGAAFLTGVLAIPQIQAPDVAALGGPTCADRSRYAGSGTSLGTRLTFRGVVTAGFGNLFYLEDPAGGPRSGMSLFAPDAPLTIGHRYMVAAAVQEFAGETEASSEVYLRDEGSQPVPGAFLNSVATLRDVSCDAGQALVNGEDFEGALVRVDSVRVTDDPPAGGDFHVAGGFGVFGDTILVANGGGGYAFDAAPLQLLRVTGVLAYRSGRFVMLPRNDADITLLPQTQVPSAANSTCPAAVTFGATGSCCFDVVVRDLLNNPIAGSPVVVGFGACPLTFCPTQPAGVTVNPAANSAQVISNAAGLAHFCICAASTPVPCATTVSADGVPLCSLQAASCNASIAGDTCTSEGWREVANSGPAPRWDSDMVANDARGSIFLFGGYGGSPGSLHDFDDTWEWDGEAWHFDPSVGPLARSGHAMAYDRARGRVVLFGGTVSGAPTGDTWEWDAVNGWIQRAASGPSARSGHVMAYDENRKQVILFGGFDGSANPVGTWAWTGSTWTLVAASGPTGRVHAAMATDPQRKRVVLYGGSSGQTAAGALDDTWEFDGSSWVRVEKPVFDGTTITQVPVTGPPARWRHVMAYGAGCGRIIITGGETAGGAFAPTTWSWDGANWREGVPGLQSQSAAMAYDIAQGKLTLFGGGLPLALSGATSQLCTLCNDEAAEMDSAGNVVFPPTLDPTAEITETDVDEDLGETRVLYPGFHTSTDSWLKDYPCATAIGGTVPAEAESPAIDDSLIALGINVSAQAMADSMTSWEAQLTTMLQADPDSLPFAPPVGYGVYPLPAQPYCPPDSGNYVFGGRDIVFVHGLQLDHIFDRIGAVFTGNFNAPSLKDWIPPTPSTPGYLLNPEFYNSNGYYRKIADDNIGEHIAAFLTKNHIRNRYLIIAYPCNDRLEVGIQAMLTQINDAMRAGINVQPPQTGANLHNFGTPSFVIVSHSTGGLLADAALHAAQTNLNLNAGFIAERCKAHVGLASALSGSRLATSALVVAGAVSAVTVVSDPWICPLFEELMSLDGVSNIPPCPITLSIALRSVLSDLVPGYTKWRWGNAVNNTNIPTVNLVGAHSYLIPILKHTISPGFDDGVLTVNCASGNPGSTVLWPNGFVTTIPLGKVQTYDMGLHKEWPPRAMQYFVEQTFDRRLQPVTRLIPDYVAAGPITYLSPTGMLQSVGWEFTGTGLDPMQRYDRHYTFMACASDHFNIRSGNNWPDYAPHPIYQGLFPISIPTYEESMALRQEDETALQAHYNTIGTFHYPNDDQPLLTPGCTPPEHDYVKGVQRGFKIKIFGKTYSKYWWVWKRHYIRPANVAGLHACDYMYASILNCESPVGLCRPTSGVTGSGAATENFARVVRNPVRGAGDAVVEFGLKGASRVQIAVYDLAGRRVHEMTKALYPPGVYRVDWDGSDARGVPVGPGMYFVRVEFAEQGFRTANKVLFLR